MSSYWIVPAYASALAHITRNMRAEDAAECGAAGFAPADALSQSIFHSSEAWVWLVDGEPVAAMGVASSILGDHGEPWFMGTPKASANRRRFLLASKNTIEEWRTEYKVLRNLVDCRYVAAIRWLTWLGFTVDTSEHIYYDGGTLPFYRFTMEC